MPLYGYGDDTRAIPITPGGYGDDARAIPMPGGNDARPMPLPDPAAPAGGGWAHPQAAFNPSANQNAPRLIQRGGQWILTEHGNERILQPDEVPFFQGEVTKWWDKFPTGEVWGSGDANDPYTGNIPFPAGVTPDPALMKPGVDYGGAGQQPVLYQPGPNTTMPVGDGAANTIGGMAYGQGSLTSGPGNWGSSYAPTGPAGGGGSLWGGAMSGAQPPGAGGMGSAIGGAFGRFGGRRPQQNTIGGVTNWGGTGYGEMPGSDPLQVR